MSMKIRPGCVNPLTALDKKAVPKLGHPAAKQADKVSELQTKQQQLQNQVLLMKASGTDSAGAAAETQKVLEAELEKVSIQLRTAKADTSGAAELVESAQFKGQPSGSRLNRDLYEPERAAASPGIYQVERDEEEGCRVSFLPYSEE